MKRGTPLLSNGGVGTPRIGAIMFTKRNPTSSEAEAAVAALSQEDRALDPSKIQMRVEPHRFAQPDWTTYNTVSYGSLAFGLLCWLLAGMAGAPGWVWAFIVIAITVSLAMIFIKAAAIWRTTRRR